MTSMKADSRTLYPYTRAWSPPRRSRSRERFSGSKIFEPERFSRPEERQRYKKSNHEDNDGELCMKKLSEFNKSLQREEPSTSTKFQWKHLLPDSSGEAAFNMPKLAMQNERTATTYSSPMGNGPYLQETKSGFIKDGEDFRYPDVGERGTIDEAVVFGGYGEELGFDSSRMIFEMARNRIRRTDEVTEFAYRKVETMRARANTVDSIIDKIDGAGENRASELDRRIPLPQQYMTVQKRELLHGERHQQREDCSGHACAQSYIGFSGEGEEVLGCRRNHAQSPKGAIFLDERQRSGELSYSPVLPQLYLDIKEKSHRNENEQDNEVLGCSINRAQNQDGAVFHGERLQFQHYTHSSGKSHETEQENEVLGCWMSHAKSQIGAGFLGESQQFRHYIHSNGKLHEMEQKNHDSGSRMNCRRSPKRAPLHGEMQGLPEDYGHSLLRNYLHFGSESHVKEQANDVSSSWMNRPQDQKRALLNPERQELSEYYGHSLPQHYLDFNVESHETQQENELLHSRMNHPHKRKGVHLHGEKQQIQEDYSHSLPLHHLGLNGESYVAEQGTEVLASRMNHPQDQKGAFFHGEREQLQRDCASESYPLPMQDDDVFATEGSTQQISATEEVGSQSSKTHPKRRIIDLRKIRESRINALNRISDASDDEILDIGYGGEQWNDEDFEQLLLLRNSGFECPQDERAVLFDELPTQRNISDRDYQFSSPHMPEVAQYSNRKSIKQRLGSPCQVQVHNPNPSNGKSIKQRLGLPSQVHNPNHSNRKSVKQRLGPPCQVPSKSNRKNVMHPLGPPCQVHNPKGMPRVERHKKEKPLKEKANDFQEGVQARVDLPDVKRGRTEPLENSEEFKQLIDAAFVKFVKVLNENLAQRRKYTEKGEAETLRCCVCGSKSKEFVNTQSLVTHAFTSRMVGHRVEHLGLHKALCFLMGWNSMAASDGLWAQKALPDAEALARKEDLVVWPPVVILHNTSIATTNADDRTIVSIEELEAFLRDMGFGRGISKVCHGKPANQSIMTVIFHGTFSGLQEAERLHKLYANKKHGRAEFQRINCSSGETQKAPVDKVEHVLYGYLGNAGDLDKLDFETKSRSVIKSKKEIYAIAGSLLDTEQETQILLQEGNLCHC